MTWPVAASAQSPINEVELHQELAKDIVTWTDGAACSHNLNVILVMDTTLDFRESTGYKAFNEAWQDLLQYYFRPGDRFTLLGFGNRIVPANPITMDYADDNIDNLRDWFENVPVVDGFGTLIKKARLGGIKLSLAAKSDTSRATLVLEVSNRDQTDGSNAQVAKEDKTSEHIAVLAKQFITGDGNDNPARFKAYLQDGNHAPSVFYVWHAFEKDGTGIAVSMPDRCMALPEVGVATTITPVDNRDKTRALAGLLLILPLLLLGYMRSTVRIIYDGRERRVVVPAWHTINVCVCSVQSPNYETSVELKLPESSDISQDVGVIDARLPGSAVWTRIDGCLTEGEGPEARNRDIPEVDLPYNSTKAVQVWTDRTKPEHAGLVKVTPAPYLEGKAIPLLGLVTAWGVALLLMAAASKPLPSTVTDAPPSSVPVCSDGRPVGD
ncbi:MAG: hypothetical protein ACLQVD_21705 [Capsulimonadaceae bacterium]